MNSGCLSRLNAQTVLPIIYGPLYKKRSGSGHRNTTVSSFAQDVLKMYKEYNLELYDQCTTTYLKEEEKSRKWIPAITDCWQAIEKMAVANRNPLIEVAKPRHIEHEAEERPEAKAAHLAAQEHSRLAPEAEEMQLAEEEDEKLVADVEVDEKRHEAEERPEAKAAHLAAQEHSRLAPEAEEMQLTEEKAEKLVADAEAEEKRHEAEERPEAKAAHLAAQDHSHLAHEANERQLTEEIAEELVVDAEAEEKILSELDVQLTKEADAGHVAQKTADCTLRKHKPLPTCNCREPCLQAGNLQMQGKNKSRSARKNVRQKASGVLVTSIRAAGRLVCLMPSACLSLPLAS